MWYTLGIWYVNNRSLGNIGFWEALGLSVFKFDQLVDFFFIELINWLFDVRQIYLSVVIKLLYISKMKLVLRYLGLMMVFKGDKVF